MIKTFNYLIQAIIIYIFFITGRILGLKISRKFFSFIFSKVAPIFKSRKIIENNWNIGTLLSYYDGVDFTFKNKKPSEYDMPFLYCIMNQKCKDRLWTEDGLVFIKGNRTLKIKSINKHEYKTNNK